MLTRQNACPCSLKDVALKEDLKDSAGNAEKCEWVKFSGISWLHDDSGTECASSLPLRQAMLVGGRCQPPMATVVMCSVVICFHSARFRILTQHLRVDSAHQCQTTQVLHVHRALECALSIACPKVPGNVAEYAPYA